MKTWDDVSKEMQSHGTPLSALGYCKIAFDARNEEVEANYSQITALDNDVKIARDKVTSLTDTLEAVTAVCNGSSALDHMDKFRLADTMLQESNNERFRAAIEKAVERLEEIDERDGGVTWHKAKEVLGADLFLVLHGLRGALVESV